jgi:hypothetical protein
MNGVQAGMRIREWGKQAKDRAGTQRDITSLVIKLLAGKSN